MLDEIIETNGFHQGGTMVVYHGLTSFGYLLAEHSRLRVIDTFRPAAYSTSPPLYAVSLLRSMLEFSFEVVAIRCSISIWRSFCSREKGCNDMSRASRCAAMLFEQ
jgi:hypothetical protein